MPTTTISPDYAERFGAECARLWRVNQAGGPLGPVEDAGADSPESLAWRLFSRAAGLVPVAVEERAESLRTLIQAVGAYAGLVASSGKRATDHGEGR